jgi:hypothetical protein
VGSWAKKSTPAKPDCGPAEKNTVEMEFAGIAKQSTCGKEPKSSEDGRQVRAVNRPVISVPGESRLAGQGGEPAGGARRPDWNDSQAREALLRLDGEHDSLDSGVAGARDDVPGAGLQRGRPEQKAGTCGCEGGALGVQELGESQQLGQAARGRLNIEDEVRCNGERAINVKHIAVSVAVAGLAGGFRRRDSRLDLR